MMEHPIGTATLIKDNLLHFKGHAALYRLDPPLVETEDYQGDESAGIYEYVVVSDTIAMMSGAETYIFPADEHGEITSWGEIEGSYRGGMSHAEALARAGYSIGKLEDGE